MVRDSEICAASQPARKARITEIHVTFRFVRMRKPKSIDQTVPQIEKFRALAREIETDDDEARFEERFKKVATAPRPEKAPPKS